MAAQSKVAIHFTKNGKKMVLDADDCIGIINALVRTRQLECHVEHVQSIARFADCCVNPACAFRDGGSRGDEVIWLEIDGQECHEGTPVEKKGGK